MHYDYLLVGAGLYNAVFCEHAVRAGKSCLVVERRSHIAGNIYTEKVEGIDVHVYGAHIFHTFKRGSMDICKSIRLLQPFCQPRQGQL